MEIEQMNGISQIAGANQIHFLASFQDRTVNFKWIAIEIDFKKTGEYN